MPAGFVYVPFVKQEESKDSKTVSERGSCDREDRQTISQKIVRAIVKKYGYEDAKAIEIAGFIQELYR